MASGTPELISRLEGICGREHVLTHAHELATYRSDGLLHYRQAPLAAVLPATGEEVAAVVKACFEAQAPLRAIRGDGLPTHTAAVGASRGRVGLLLGCVQRVFYPDVHRATIAVLAAEGFEVIAPRLPSCCGALELHGGAEPAAIERAEATIAAFAQAGGAAGLDHIVVNAAGCGSAMKEYGELLGTPEAQDFSARVRDVNELLGEVEPRAPRGPLPLRVVYHDACHLAHAQGVRRQPRDLLGSIPELELVEVPVEKELCCGSAGIYNLVEPETAAELGRRKAEHLISTGAQAIAAGNPGCAAQLDLHLRVLDHPLPIHHPVELLWRSLQAAPEP